MALLMVRNLSVTYTGKHDDVHALHEFSCSVHPGQSLGILGESGSGKTTLALALQGLLTRQARIACEKLEFANRNILKLSDAEMRKIRGGQMSMIPQNAQNALNPVLTIGRQFVEHLMLHARLAKREAVDQAKRCLAEVGLDQHVMECRPHQLSGGMRQRVVIAMVYSIDPALIIADEPTNALDEGNRDQIIALLKQFQRAKNTALLVISHDLHVIAAICDHVTVLHHGRSVDKGSFQQIMQKPRHDYTRLLFQAADRLGKYTGLQDIGMREYVG